MSGIFKLGLCAAVVGVLQGCASAPPAPGDVVAQATTPKKKCQENDIPRTGSAIVRLDCHADSDVLVVDPRELMATKRTAMPDPLTQKH